MMGSPGGSDMTGDVASLVMMAAFAVAIVVTRHRRDVPMLPATCLAELLLVLTVAPISTPGQVDGRDLVLLVLTVRCRWRSAWALRRRRAARPGRRGGADDPARGHPRPDPGSGSCSRQRPDTATLSAVRSSCWRLSSRGAPTGAAQPARWRPRSARRAPQMGRWMQLGLRPQELLQALYSRTPARSMGAARHEEHRAEARPGRPATVPILVAAARRRVASSPPARLPERRRAARSPRHPHPSARSWSAGTG